MIVKRPTTFLLCLIVLNEAWQMKRTHKNVDPIKQTWILKSLRSGKNVNFIYFANKRQDKLVIKQIRGTTLSQYNVDFPTLGPDV